MLFKYLAIALAPFIVSAVPVRRDNSTAGSSTIQTFQVLDTLEKLQTKFYQDVLGKFKAADFAAAGFKDGTLVPTELAAMEAEDAAHATTLDRIVTGTGQTPVQCQFNTDGLTKNVTTAVAAARLLKQVGVSTYVGALGAIGNAVDLTALGSITTTDSRHQAIHNVLNGASPFPQNFEPALLPQEAVTITQRLISGCNLTAGIQPNTPLYITNPGVITNGTALQLSSPALTGNNNASKLYCQQVNGNPNGTTVLPVGQCVVSSSANGPNLLYVTNTSQPLSGNIQERQGQSNIIKAGPAMYFADETPDPIGKLVVSTSQQGANSAVHGNLTTNYNYSRSPLNPYPSVTAPSYGL